MRWRGAASESRRSAGAASDRRRSSACGREVDGELTVSLFTRLGKCSNLRTLLCHACTRLVPRAARKLQMSRTRDVAQDSTGYRGYHRVSSGLGGRTPELPFLARILPFLARLLPFCQHILPFLAICTEKFWISQGIEDIRGFQRVSQGFERRVGLPHSSAG